jgi:hypothetical protein
MKEHVMFGCHPKRWLIALRAEWDKALGKGKHAAKVGKPRRVTLQQARQERAAVLEGHPVGEQVAPAELPKGHLPVTDWRVWDQRYFGYYTWLEPPMQPEPQKCAMCGSLCIKVHRRAMPGLCPASVLSLLLLYPSWPCTRAHVGGHGRAPNPAHMYVKHSIAMSVLCRCHTCKRIAYCGSMCARAHMFDHECELAPKPWLSPPVGVPPVPPPELGEEGFLGIIPWWALKYALIIATLYGAVLLWRRFGEFRCCPSPACVILVWLNSLAPIRCLPSAFVSASCLSVGGG